VSLKTGVGDHIVGVCPKVVAKGDVPIEFTALGKAQVEMVGNMVERRPKRLAAGNPQIAAVHITQPVESLDRGREILAPAENNVDVDDWFSRQSGDRGAADVLDRGRQAAKRRSDPGAEGLKLFGP